MSVARASGANDGSERFQVGLAGYGAVPAFGTPQYSREREKNSQMALRLAATALVSVLVPVTSGCCSLARLLCGPAQTEWVRVAFDTPEATIRTFLEAIRRDNPDRVYECLAEDYKKARGLDQVVANVLWEKIRQEAPGYHLVGYATPGDPVRQKDGSVYFLFEVEGHRLRVDLVQQAFWEVAWRTPEGLRKQPGAYVMTLQPYATCEPDRDGDRSVLTIRLGFPLGDADSVPLADIESAGIGREWKVADFRELPPE
jgi:hypothetical protein